MFRLDEMTPDVLNSEDYPFIDNIRGRVMDRVSRVEDMTAETPLLDRLFSVGTHKKRKK